MLQKVNATIDLRKIKMAKNKIDFIGMLLSAVGSSISKRFMQSMYNVKPAKNIKQLRGLMRFSIGNLYSSLITMS